MADFSALIQRIKDAVYENGVQAITGQILQDCLKDVVNTVNVAKQDGIYRVTVTVDNNTGVPSATARMDDDTYTLEFSFHNLKGGKGDKGDKGDTPVLTADSDGVIYSDGVMLTRVIKDTTDALTTRADSDHARAESDHARAETDHTDITRARLDAESAAGEANYASLRANTAADNADAARGAIQSDLAAKQDVIPDLQQIRAGATDTVKYTSQTLTDAQKGQARTNIGAASDSEVSQLRSKVDGLALGKFYGFFPADADLPAGDDAGYAYVGASAPFAIYVFDGSSWSDSGSVYSYPVGNGEDIDLNGAGQLQFANRTSGDGMGYKILRTDASFASQVTDVDTIYEIRYDFDLGGASVTIPAGCVLRFNGGKLSNGDVDLNSVFLEGEPRFDGIVFSGQVANGLFDATWIVDGSDIGAKINYASQYFPGICTPFADYTYSTPIVVNPNGTLYFTKRLHLDGNFIYNGVVTNGGAAMTINRAGKADIFINAVSIANNSMIDHSDNRSVNFIGICFKNCATSRVRINSVTGFNEGIRSMATGGSNGLCSYLRFFVNSIENCNIGWRIYWADIDGINSYSNEQTIYGVRISTNGSVMSGASLYGIVIGPPDIDPASYRQHTTPANTGCSNIGVYETCFEGAAVGITVYTLNGLRIIGCREEAVNKMVNVLNQCNELTYIPAYLNKLNLGLDYAKSVVMSDWPFVTEYTIQKRGLPFVPENFVIKNYNNVQVDRATAVYRTFVGVIIDTSNTKVFRVFRYNDNDERITDSSLSLTYLNDAGTAEIDNVDNYPVPYQGHRDAASYCFFLVGTFVVPSGVNKIFVGASVNSAKKLRIMSTERVPIITNSVKTFGPSSDRPSFLPAGIGYYDETISKLIYMVNNAWVDATGASV